MYSESSGNPAEFLDDCRTALDGKRLNELNEYASGRSPRIGEIDDNFGSGHRARAVAHLALALTAELEDAERARHLQAAIELWTLEGDALPAEVPVTLTPGATTTALAQICLGEHRLRLEGLHDIALELGGESPRGLRRATTAVPVVVGGGGLLLLIEARLVSGALPGVFEGPQAALANRDEKWRRMEQVVDELILRQDGPHAIRYLLKNNADSEVWLGPVHGESAGMALAVASRQATKRRSLPLDGHTAIAAAIAEDGRAQRVEGMAEKLAEKEPKTGEPEVHHLQRRVVRLLVEKKQAKTLVPDGIAQDRTVNREAVVAAGIDVVPIANLDEAMRKARLRLRRPALIAIAVTLIVAAAITFALTRDGNDPGLERRVAESQLPDKVDAAARRLAATDPDRVALLRAEEATVQPSPASLSALFDADLGVSKRITSYRPREGVVSEIALADGRRLVVTGGANGELRVWDSRTREEEVLSRDALEDEARMLAVSEDGHLIAVSGTGSVLLAERSSSGLFAELEEELSGGASAVAFSADGKALYVGAEDSLGVSRFEAGGWSPIEWSSVDAGGHYVRDIIPLDADHVAFCIETTGNDQELRRLDLRRLALSVVRGPGGSAVPCPAAQLRPGVIATTHGPDYREIRIGRLEGARWRQVGYHRLPEELDVLGEVPGGHLVYTAGDTGVTTLSESGEVVAEAPLNPSDVGISVGRGGRSFAVVSGNGMVRVESLEDEDPLTPRLRLSDPSSLGWPVSWSANGERVAVGSQEGDVSVFDPRDPDAGALVWKHVFPGIVRAVEVDPLGRWVWAAGDTGQVARIDARDPTADIHYSVALGGVIRDLELSPDGKNLAVAGVPGVGVVLMRPDVEGFENGGEEIDALGVAWLDSDRLLVSSGADSEGDRSEAILRVLNTHLEQVGGNTPTGDPGMIAVRVHGKRAAAVGFSGRVEIFNVAGDTPRLLRTVSTENELATDAAWSADGGVLAVVGDGSKVTFLETRTFQVVGARSLGDSGGGAALATHGGTLATLAVAQATVKLIPFGTSAWSQEICDRTHQFLSPADWIELVGPWPPYQRPCRPRA
ncbi:MAG TPA: WD40 repeat domain-containing protein [Solirubrobacterales bacterium]|nr:WD40 repeat domain-containing protein [Solirubrobacterales bacterium]